MIFYATTSNSDMRHTYRLQVIYIVYYYAFVKLAFLNARCVLGLK